MRKIANKDILKKIGVKMLVKLNKNNFETNISTGIKLVEFYAPWCHFCQRQKNDLEELSKTGTWIGLINADENPELVNLYRVTVYPSFILFKNGEILTRFQGLKSKYEIMNILKDFIPK